MALVGTVVSAGNAAGLSYRTTWRYSNVKEQLVLTLTSCAVFLVLVTLGALRIVALPMSTVLLVPLLTFALSTGARTLRRWQLAYTRRRRSVGGLNERRLAASAVRIVVASLAMGATAYAVNRWLPPLLPSAALVWQIVSLTLAIAAALLVLAGAAWALRIEEFNDSMRMVLGRFRRRS